MYYLPYYHFFVFNMLTFLERILPNFIDITDLKNEIFSSQQIVYSTFKKWEIFFRLWKTTKNLWIMGEYM